MCGRRLACRAAETAAQPKRKATRSALFEASLHPFCHFASYLSQMPKRTMLLAAMAAVFAYAHPMGNFSVNHYGRFEPVPGGVKLHYVVDLAEIPTFELFQQWGEGADPKRKAV